MKPETLLEDVWEMVDDARDNLTNAQWITFLQTLSSEAAKRATAAELNPDGEDLPGLG